MEHYDVIIVGAGIAGCGLAYNLNKEGYKGKVLVIDKKEPGANAAYGYRNTFKEVIDEYKLPYKRTYKGLNIGAHKGPKIKLDIKFYLLDYKEICQFLLKKSSYKFRIETAEKVEKNTLKTNKGVCSFQYLIDCSGASFFLKKLFHWPIPFKYYIGKVKVYKNKGFNLNPDYFYYLGGPDGYVEDFYMFKDKIIQGDWQISNEINFKKIKSPNYRLLNQISPKPKLIKQGHVIGPVSPVFPIAYKNYACLGDSFGNATAYVGEGVRPILNTSKILVSAIINDNLKSYERIWKKRYLSSYIKVIAARTDLKNRFKLLDIMKDNPQLLIQTLKNENVQVPKQIIKRYPKRLLVKLIYNYLVLRAKYLLRIF